MAADIQIAGGTGELGNQHTAGAEQRPSGSVGRPVTAHAHHPRRGRADEGQP